MPQGKTSFPLGHSLTFSCARKPQTFRSPRLTGGGCLFSPPSNSANYGSRDEPPMTACGGYFIGGEINRNEQCPHEADLRRLRLRTLSTLAQGPQRPENMPFGMFSARPGRKAPDLGARSAQRNPQLVHIIVT